MHPADLQESLDLFSAIVLGEEVVGFVNRLRAADGSYRFLEWRSVMRSDLCYAAARDITPQVSVQNALRKERDLFSQGPVFTLLWETGPSTKILYVSSNITSQLGCTAQEVCSPQFSYEQWIHPEDRKLFRQTREKALVLRQSSFEISYRLRTTEGRYRWYHDFSRLDGDLDHEHPVIRSYLVDQTRIKEVELELESQRQRLLQIIEATNVGTWEFDLSSGRVFINDRFASMLGYTKEELGSLDFVGCLKFLFPDDVDKLRNLLDAHFAGQTDRFNAEARAHHKTARMSFGS
ncbi:MAG: PAS domain-containing protein [Verrucomicrobia bacterium]|nr:PAS domain-containing protein [Verrucomicrobiota bacterium]